MSKKFKIRLSLALGILSWLLFSFFDTYFIILDRYEMKEAFAELVPQVFLSLFILSSLFYYRYVITKADSVHFMDLLWRVFITGLVTTLFSLAIRLLFNLFAETSFITNPVTVNFFYHIYVGLVLLFLISTFVAWKRLILYQKSKSLIRFWDIFEYLLYAALVFDFLEISSSSMAFTIFMLVIGILSVGLSFNLKWIAYLNFAQKWKSILFILLTAVYLYHFFINMGVYSSTKLLTFDLLDRVFVMGLLGFIVIYAGISVLVTLFNLPTSSVFERKLQEAVDFQKLSQTITTGQQESDTYEILLESSMSAVFADAAWIEIKKPDGESEMVKRNLTSMDVELIKEQVKKNELSQIVNLNFTEKFSQPKSYSNLGKGAYRSIFALPLMIKGKQAGALVLLQEVADAFNREMANIITTFVNQASIAIENARLLHDALETERYKEQLKIAKTVQKSLLPRNLAKNDQFRLTAYSAAADEVGGDYYDFIDFANGKYGLIIGDVSGKGTSAAFYMAQMKGVFHSLASQNCSAADFMIKANEALSRCLEKSSFITASYFIIDTQNKSIEHVRAGHCPALFYDKSKNNVKALCSNGMGLGIIRNSDYENYVSSNVIQYKKGDILMVYTDGFSEAMSQSREQFGDESLKNILLKNAAQGTNEIKDAVIEGLNNFMNGTKLDDDYTLVVAKFN